MVPRHPRSLPKFQSFQKAGREQRTGLPPAGRRRFTLRRAQSTRVRYHLPRGVSVPTSPEAHSVSYRRFRRTAEASFRPRRRSRLRFRPRSDAEAGGSFTSALPCHTDPRKQTSRAGSNYEGSHWRRRVITKARSLPPATVVRNDSANDSFRFMFRGTGPTKPLGPSNYCDRPYRETSVERLAPHRMLLGQRRGRRSFVAVGQARTVGRMPSFRRRFAPVPPLE